MALFCSSASLWHLRGFYAAIHTGIPHFTNKIAVTRVFYTTYRILQTTQDE